MAADEREIERLLREGVQEAVSEMADTLLQDGSVHEQVAVSLRGRDGRPLVRLVLRLSMIEFMVGGIPLVEDSEPTGVGNGRKFDA